MPYLGRVKIVKKREITADEIEEWGAACMGRNGAFTWFAEVLNGEASVEERREDCLSIIDPGYSEKKDAPPPARGSGDEA